ncbi:hypothetical protein HMH01_17165 [Halovulum dunhuangense]|uniref:Uncharacterized protein n=1 Tax=Halovulum dunhuangense TaxID=1505036 RepID=A0A849L7W4_9RHOB|nr:exopolysaccharide biosynthesis protein [Halovulum dunhuangense]NNU82170.1 hypothetical protein [Halovulum dunhuangense]
MPAQKERRQSACLSCEGIVAPFSAIPALAICVIALGILERDSLWIALGTLLGLVSLLIVVGVVYALVKSALYLLVNTFA